MNKNILKTILLLLFSLLFSVICLGHETDDIDKERSKYIRNHKFNDSYLDIFFRTSPGLLPINSLFIDENLIFRSGELMSMVPMSRTKLSRRSDFSFESVPIYDFYTGEVSLSSYSFLSNFFYLNVESVDSVSFPSIGTVYNIRSDTNLRRSNANINIGIGNQLGSFSGHYFTSLKQFKYFISGSYINSAGIEVPKETDDENVTLLNVLKNSDYELGSVFGKLLFDNGNSQVGLTSFFSKGYRAIPTAHSRNRNIEYLSIPNIYETLLNFEFQTTLENFVQVSGNIFYKNTFYKLSSFDDSTYTKQDLLGSYNYLTFGYNYGGRAGVNIDWGWIPPSTFGVAYIRDILNKREDDNLETNRFEVENLSLFFKQPFRYNNFLSYFTVQYNIKKPLFSDISLIVDDFKSMDYRLDLSYRLSNNFRITADLSSEKKMPSIREIFNVKEDFFNTVIPIKPEHETNSSFGLLGINSDFEISGKFYVSSIDDVIESEMQNNYLKFFNNGNASCYGFDVNFKVFADYGYILFNYTFTDFINKPNFSRKPKHLGEIKIYNIYDFGLRWLLEAEYFSNSIFINKNQSDFNKNIVLLNFRLGLRLIQKNEVFIGIYNILDAYYESEYGVPDAGFSFLMGVSVNI